MKAAAVPAAAVVGKAEGVGEVARAEGVGEVLKAEGVGEVVVVVVMEVATTRRCFGYFMSVSG